MNPTVQLVLFSLDAQRYALPLVVVERVLRAVEVTPLPKAPSIVLGVIDVGGRVLPVLNLRQRFGLPEREIAPADQFLMAHASQRPVALAIDEAQGMIERPETEILNAAGIVPGLEHIRGLVKLDGGLVLIQDLERVLSLDEARILNEAMEEVAAHEI